MPKHQGISYFAFEMHQPGVDVRPLKEMTGHALFNEVFITDARVADSALIGGANNGWAAANTTLMNERAGSRFGRRATPPAVAWPNRAPSPGCLGKRVGDFVSSANGRPAAAANGGAFAARRGGADMLIALAKSRGLNGDAVVRQDLARLYILGELGGSTDCG